MPLIPLGILEQVLKLVNTLIEGIPAEQRRATAIAWFWLWWPVAKLWLTDEQEKQIEAIIKGA